MKQWYESSVRVERTTDDGSLKAVAEKYLFEAESYTDAEEKTLSHIVTPGEMSIENITKKKYADVLLNDAEDTVYFCAAVEFVTIDERTAKEKKTIERTIIQAPDLSSAHFKIVEHLRDSLVDYAIVSIARTKLIDVIHS